MFPPGPSRKPKEAKSRELAAPPATLAKANGFVCVFLEGGNLGSRVYAGVWGAFASLSMFISSSCGVPSDGLSFWWLFFCLGAFDGGFANGFDRLLQLYSQGSD